MEFRKIQLTTSGTLNVTYVDNDSNTVSLTGANIVHRDLRLAFRAVIPHLALMTEQREAAAASLEDLQKQEHSEDGNSVYKIISVDDLNLSDNEQEVSVGGTRILKGGRVMKITAPKITVCDEEAYEYCGELQLALEAIIYESKEYVDNRKWGIKQAELFEGDDPFEGVEPEKAKEVTVTVEVDKPKKRGGRKTKQVQISAMA